uniref:phosphatidate phosphatase n=1 Tax=Oncorhynchus kisutch TaxID=8019 RepID=A0A8C7FSQ5_ONCKI
MNYVGQLAGQVFVQVKELYRGLNPATLSGCIDVIVVRQPDGTLQCSPFHVRFGKMGVLRSQINGEPVSLQMKLGENGEAFFVKETENTLVCTHTTTNACTHQHTHTHSTIAPETERVNREREQRVNKERDIERCSTGSTNHIPLCDLLPSSPGGSSPSTPKSDSELTNQSKDNPEMMWAWGELPQAAKAGSWAGSGAGCGARSWPGGDMEEVWAACREVEGLVASRMLSELDEGCHRDNTVRHTDSPSKRKDKRSHHLGSDGIYLDDITELEPDVAALYFPKSDGGGSVRGGLETGVRSANQSPQSVGSSGMDSGVDSYSDQLGDMPNIAISLCGGLTDNREITREQFEERAISYQQFTENPSIIDDPNLVVKIGTKYYNWTTAAPLMLAMQVYQKPLPMASVENIMKEKMPKKGGRWWFSWRSRNSDSKSVHTSAQIHTPIMKEESSSSDEDHRLSNQGSESCNAEPLLTPGSVCYRKTLRLTPEQLASLQLKVGPNEVVFSVTTQYQGTCRCQGTIYLWSWDDKIIISDIDGTITRSDTLGHILPTLGKDWTHQGIARLYHRVSQNGYKFMYCSARAIGMADMTRGYLHWVNERGTMLPIGPVLLSPSSLFSALHREVIEKKPERFKIQCLTDVKQLFYPNTEPFYAAFGNRATDVYSYKEVGVPLNRIFTVNPKGELIQEHAKTNISSYGGLCEVVDHVFPLLIRGHVSDISCPDTFSQFTYWREQLPQYSPTLAFFLFCCITTCNLNVFLFGFNVMDIHKMVK